jgi:hypothetical protein
VNAPPREPDWEEVLKAAASVQGLVPGAILVGGTAVALYAGHRRSFDADHVLPDLRERFETLLGLLEGRADWTTHRLLPSKLILGRFDGVETGLRQLIRSRPLETNEVETNQGSLVVPTPEELLRIKGWLVVTRNATRDFVDVAALSAWLGPERTPRALSDFDLCYQDLYRRDEGRDVSPLLQLSRQLADPRPYDIHGVDLAEYKGIVPPWCDWQRLRAQCRTVATLVAERLVADHSG